MPFGPGLGGFAYFAAVKWLGYSGYAVVVNRTKPMTDSKLRSPNPWWVGSVRTGIGVAVGAAVGLGYWSVASHLPAIEAHADGIFFAFLVPVRILEWLLLLTLFYRKFQFDRRRIAILIICGILVSFALDAIGVFAAFVLPGGMWVC
jgi:hypothetical protein